MKKLFTILSMLVMMNPAMADIDGTTPVEYHGVSAAALMYACEHEMNFYRAHLLDIDELIGRLEEKFYGGQRVLLVDVASACIETVGGWTRNRWNCVSHFWME